MSDLIFYMGGISGHVADILMTLRGLLEDKALLKVVRNIGRY